MTDDTLRLGPVAAAIRRHRLIVVLRRVEPQAALLDLVGELADAGARVFEITFDAPSAEADLAAVRGCLAGRSDGPFLVGAGTILRRGQLEAARRAGADFAVAPLAGRLARRHGGVRGPAVHPGRVHADRDRAPRGRPGRRSSSCSRRRRWGRRSYASSAGRCPRSS